MARRFRLALLIVCGALVATAAVVLLRGWRGGREARGELRVRRAVLRLELNAGAGATLETVKTEVAGRRVGAAAELRSGRVLLRFEPAVRIAAGETLSLIA